MTREIDARPLHLVDVVAGSLSVAYHDPCMFPLGRTTDGRCGPVTQGNPFGQKGGRWMPAAKLRALFAAGRTYDEVAEANLRAEGWKPSRSAVLRKYRELGMPPRNASHTDLIPWNIQPEHSDHLFRHMLQAESRRRQKRPLSETDRKLISRLDEMLFGRGTLMVIDYHPETGFSLVLREDADEDIIRKPARSASLRKELKAALREDDDAELVARALREKVRPELLENAGRDQAADTLRRLLAQEGDVKPERIEAEEAPPARRNADRDARRRAAEN
jgi:hypothetical protein